MNELRGSDSSRSSAAERKLARALPQLDSRRGAQLGQVRLTCPRAGPARVGRLHPGRISAVESHQRSEREEPGAREVAPWPTRPPAFSRRFECLNQYAPAKRIYSVPPAAEDADGTGPREIPSARALNHEMTSRPSAISIRSSSR